jgi:hypothetical protein
MILWKKDKSHPGQNQQQQQQSDRLHSSSPLYYIHGAGMAIIRFLRPDSCGEDIPSREEKLLARLDAMAAERNKLAIQVVGLTQDLGAYDRMHMSGQSVNLDETAEMVAKVLSEYSKLVALIEAENRGLRGELSAAKEETIKAYSEANAQAELIRQDRRRHEGNAAMAESIMDEQARMIAVLEEKLGTADKRLTEAEDRRLYDGYLKDLRRGATFKDTGAKFYREKCSVSN